MGKLYKLITILTLILPLTVYLFLSATLFNIKPTVIIKHAKISDLSLYINEGVGFIYTDVKEAIITATIVYNEDYDRYGVLINEKDIIKTDDGYWGLINNGLTNIKELEIQKETSYRLPIAVVISAIGCLFVFLSITKKMDLVKKYPRISVMISLITTTIILALINTIVSNLLNVFLIASISWALYLIEYYTQHNLIAGKQVEKAESDLLALLKEGLK